MYSFCIIFWKIKYVYFLDCKSSSTCITLASIIIMSTTSQTKQRKSRKWRLICQVRNFVYQIKLSDFKLQFKLFKIFQQNLSNNQLNSWIIKPILSIHLTHVKENIYLSFFYFFIIEEKNKLFDIELKLSYL